MLDGGSGVMYAPGRIMKSGSSSNDGATPDANSAATTYVLNMNDASPAWRQTQSMAFPRTYHNLTSLADGTVLVTSGSRKKSETNLSDRRAAGGAVVAGHRDLDDDGLGAEARASITRPPYCCRTRAWPFPVPATSPAPPTRPTSRSIRRRTCSRAARPTITSAPSLVKYGTSFFVQTPDGADIKAVNLIRPGAATHSFDQDQRFVPVTFSVVAGGIQVNAPSNPNLAAAGLLHAVPHQQCGRAVGREVRALPGGL